MRAGRSSPARRSAGGLSRVAATFRNDVYSAGLLNHWFVGERYLSSTAKDLMDKEGKLLKRRLMVRMRLRPILMTRWRLSGAAGYQHGAGSGAQNAGTGVMGDGDCNGLGTFVPVFGGSPLSRKNRYRAHTVDH